MRVLYSPSSESSLEWWPSSRMPLTKVFHILNTLQQFRRFGRTFGCGLWKMKSWPARVSFSKAFQWFFLIWLAVAGESGVNVQYQEWKFVSKLAVLLMPLSEQGVWGAFLSDRYPVLFHVLLENDYMGDESASQVWEERETILQFSSDNLVGMQPDPWRSFHLQGPWQDTFLFQCSVIGFLLKVGEILWVKELQYVRLSRFLRFSVHVAFIYV